MDSEQKQDYQDYKRNLSEKKNIKNFFENLGEQIQQDELKNKRLKRLVSENMNNQGKIKKASFKSQNLLDSSLL